MRLALLPLIAKKNCYEIYETTIFIQWTVVSYCEVSTMIVSDFFHRHMQNLSAGMKNPSRAKRSH